MPIYTYRCSNCGKQEMHQSVHDESLTSCPICGTIDYRKVFTPTGVSFKGKGFYSTDTRGKQ